MARNPVDRAGAHPDGNRLTVIEAGRANRVYFADLWRYRPGRYLSRCEIPGNLLNEGTYFVGLCLTTLSTIATVHFFEFGAISFNVRDPIEGTESRCDWGGTMPGSIRPNLVWTTEKLS